MSRIGNKAITVPAGVEVSVAAGNEVTVKGPKGTLTREFTSLVTIDVQDGTVKVIRSNEEKKTKQLHGTTRALLASMIEGVNKGFEKTLKIVGIGYKAVMKGSNLELFVGYSHTINCEIPEDVKVELVDATTVKVSGIDKQKVGQFAASVRNHRKPEPYGGKGIRYIDEHVRRKEGKTAASKK